MKKRLDELLTEQGWFNGINEARAAIMEGRVFVDGRIADKPGMSYKTDLPVTVKGSDCPYVSRGGLKLQGALESFEIDVTGLSCIDIGASTGGFTDCLLQHGAARVYAVDSGTNQLAWSLRSDPRVISMERCNFRYFDPSLIEEKLGFACCDVSFISISRILPPARQLLAEGAHAVILIKPQFEAAREDVGEGGIVRDPEVHAAVIEKCFGYAREAGFSVLALTHSPVTGTKGNIEFLMHLAATAGRDADIDIQAAVSAAGSALGSRG